MATASPVTLLTTAVVAAAVSPAGSSRRRSRVHCITGLNSFDGLKAHNEVVSLGVPVSTERCFAKFVCSLAGGGGGGGLAATCSAVDEIFRIAAIMNALVLIGVAVGFVLLKIEASLEEE